MKPLVKWRLLPNQDRILVLAAIPLLVAIRLGLALLPLEKLLHTLTRVAKAFPARGPTKRNSVDRKIRAIEKIGKYVLGDGPCLSQALAVQFIMDRHGQPSELCIGVAKDEYGKLIAHAWIESDGRVLIGESGTTLEDYTRLPSLKGKIH